MANQTSVIDFGLSKIRVLTRADNDNGDDDGDDDNADDGHAGGAKKVATDAAIQSWGHCVDERLPFLHSCGKYIDI